MKPTIDIMGRIGFIADQICINLEEDIRSRSSHEDASAFGPWHESEISDQEAALLWGYFKCAGEAWKSKQNIYSVNRLMRNIGSARKLDLETIMEIGKGVDQTLLNSQKLDDFERLALDFTNRGSGHRCPMEIERRLSRSIGAVTGRHRSMMRALDLKRAAESLDRKRHEVREHVTNVSVKMVRRHLSTLTRKRRRLVSQDEYGVINNDKWIREIHYFFANVIAPEIGYPVESYFDQASVEVLIDGLVELGFSTATGTPQPETKGVGHREFEFACAEIMGRQGWRTRVTKGSGDQGVDLIAERNGIKVAVQCKMYSGVVGNGAVQEVYSGKSFYGADIGIVVTTSGFTSSAKELARALDVYLLHESQLTELDRILLTGARK